MTLPKETDRLTRFIHEEYHEIAKDNELKDVWVDLVSIVIGKWEDWREKNIDKPSISRERLVEVMIKEDAKEWNIATFDRLADAILKEVRG